MANFFKQRKVKLKTNNPVDHRKDGPSEQEKDEQKDNHVEDWEKELAKSKDYKKNVLFQPEVW